jgi:hypothetical protein
MGRSTVGRQPLFGTRSGHREHRIGNVRHCA